MKSSLEKRFLVIHEALGKSSDNLQVSLVLPLASTSHEIPNDDWGIAVESVDGVTVEQVFGPYIQLVFCAWLARNDYNVPSDPPDD